jgi:sulfhydrogenase subunit beta (sulfur reductase)
MKVTTREALATWLDGLMQDHAVIAPVPLGGRAAVEQEVVYDRVAASSQINFDFERTVLSPKTFFLPDTQVLLRVDRQDRETMLREPAMLQEQVLFGLRPCDVQGLHALDALLLDREPADSYYAERRERSTLIVLACPQLWDSCFCTSLGSAPDDCTGADIMLYEDSGEYLVEPVTGRGGNLLQSLDMVEKGEGRRKEQAQGWGEGARVPVPPPETWEGLFDHAYWQRLADRCLSCHACTYVCPTCRCFDVRDETIRSGAGLIQIQRLRAWDSCMSPAYRRIAGGHNPRPTGAQRLRNRYYCKFCYSPTYFGSVACVGCGRCIDVCPVGIDIAEMLADVAALEQYL